jgi:HAD superfamily hydrolase (TIGR01509 family)
MEPMNIIIPLAGKGERFLKKGYKDPKTLIKVFDKLMIDYVLNNIKITDQDIIFILYNVYLDNFNFSEIVASKYPHIHLIKVNDTKGAAETLYIGIDYILKNYKYNKKSLLIDCDTFYTEDIVSLFRNSDTNAVFYTKNYNPNPLYSYIELDTDSRIIHIAEKKKISDNANTGAYAFSDIHELHSYCKHVLDNNITFNNEPYTSCVISEMIKASIHFKGIQLNSSSVFSLGTPTELETYVEKTHAFLFDLDGTLVLTDSIYYDVWYSILNKYNITLTHGIYKNYIQGNNDTHVMKTLLTNITIDPSELSRLKDELFIKNIDKIKLIDGVFDILEQIRSSAHKCCVVTNCNRHVADTIVKYTGIDKYIDFIISSDDCKYGKPNSEPYLKAINTYGHGMTNHKCFIFEDSKSGLLSARSVHPKVLVGLQTIYSSDEIAKYDVTMSILDYKNFDIQTLLNYDDINVDKLKTLIVNSINDESISDVLIDDTKLKGGFIADVIKLQVITNTHRANISTSPNTPSSPTIYNYILKYENKNVNNLSTMAKKLDLYNREYYFYQTISPHLNVKIPKFIALLKDSELNTTGLILENLFQYKGFKINLNLNVESIDISLKIVNRMAKMHSKFWNKNLEKLFPELKKNTDPTFRPFFKNFISEKSAVFMKKWSGILTPSQLEKAQAITADFENIQERLSATHTTFIHGDIKSPNIFYDTENDNEPYFLDWQHCAWGKGVQDLVFFIIESFDITHIKVLFPLFKHYYYKKLVDYGILNYSFQEYEKDILDAIYYVPFFTAVWFGTTPTDELIDKNFPFFFIQKLFYVIDMLT